MEYKNISPYFIIIIFGLQHGWANIIDNKLLILMKSCAYDITEYHYECNNGVLPLKAVGVNPRYQADPLKQCVKLHNNENEVMREFYNLPFIRNKNEVLIDGFAIGTINEVNNTCHGIPHLYNREFIRSYLLRVEVKITLNHSVIGIKNDSQGTDFSTHENIYPQLPSHCRYEVYSCLDTTDQIVYYWDKIL
ncbi:ORF3 [Drosophila unispina virus 1]|uniref:ORF3 n=1 Tax=Drosophila unispina virus 1 TaxID=1802951 RepID=A0A140D8N4_9MONO|nr:ORF3 [Drosophila unispina virus 1]AMK09258.1 ORF3 [Drosophila unispina virus 1]